MHRVANTVRVSATPVTEIPFKDDYARERTDFFRRVPISPRAPYLRFSGPAVEPEEEEPRRYRINYTMQETLTIHSEMVEWMNLYYDEVWTPTQWNANVFRASGVRTPIRVMPLGIDPHVYKPGARGEVPESELITTKDAGTFDTPSGFLFIYVFLPSYRKGLDFLFPAFEEAFSDDPNVGLVLAVTHNTMKDPWLDTMHTHLRSRIWKLTGYFTDHQLADIYRSCDAYVCPSRGEGWNLPMMEAAACGLPVVVGRHTAHLDLVDDKHGYLFDTEGQTESPEGSSISRWYDGVPFAQYGCRSHAQLVRFLRTIRGGAPDVKEKAARYKDKVRTHYTWDRAASLVTERLLELQG